MVPDTYFPHYPKDMQSSQEKTPQKSLIAYVLLGGIVVVVLFALFFALVASTVSSNKIRTHRVTGYSMSPAVMGAHRLIHCPKCDIEIQIPLMSVGSEQQKHESLETLPVSVVQCWHCGSIVHVLSNEPNSVFVPGERVTVTPAVFSEIRIGDLVAIEIEGVLRVKRLMGIPGDTISIDEDRLLLNGQRFEDLLAERSLQNVFTMRVDQDSLREHSRWQPLSESGSNQDDWNRMERQWRCHCKERDSQWIAYRHFAVYEQDRPSAILDDYPVNVGEVRHLQKIDRPQLVIKVDGVASDVSLEVAFFREGKTYSITKPIRNATPTTFRCTEAASIVDLELSELNPIAVRMRGNVLTEMMAVDFLVERWVEYRLRRSDSRKPYPLKLVSGECFVVGDNVPASVDSRDWGAVPIDSIRGKVELIAE